MEEARAWAEAAGDATAGGLAERFAASGAPPLEARVLPSADPRGAYAGWLGRMRYRQGRFAEAAELLAEAAASTRWVTGKLAALVRSASARMEAFQLDLAAVVAHEAVATARRHRLPSHEASAEWIARSVAYRTGVPIAPDLELVEAAAQLRIGDTEAILCLNEAAIAFRAGRAPLARELARRAQRAWAALGEVSGGALLAASLALACGDGGDGDRDRDRDGDGAQEAQETPLLIDRAVACSVPAVGIQVLGLLALAGGRQVVAVGGETRAALAAQVPAERWDRRLDVLSVREALDALEGLSRRSSRPSRR
jgi:hypothetical protein